MKTLGLDEAGRGCVLGPLVVGGFLADSETAKISKMRVQMIQNADPQTPVQIREAYLNPLGQPVLRVITPSEIDAGNLNTSKNMLSYPSSSKPILNTSSSMPRAIHEGSRLHPKHACHARLIECGGRLPTFTIEPKADANFPICGAASIFAKVSETNTSMNLGAVGSGYPSDPVTRTWLTGFIRTR